MNAATSTPARLLSATAGSGQPLVTFYDDATGERVELSGATFANWVAKTAGMLTDGLDVGVGDRVALALPAHWHSLVWAAACWTVGACVVTNLDGPVAVVAAEPGQLAAATGVGAAAVVGLTLRPLGGRFTTLPDGVLDYAVEVPGYPDHFVPFEPVGPEEPALEHAGHVVTASGLVDHARDRAEQLGAQPGARVLAATDDLVASLQDALLVPLVVGGSGVLVRHEDPGTRTDRITAEHVSVVA